MFFLNGFASSGADRRLPIDKSVLKKIPFMSTTEFQFDSQNTSDNTLPGVCTLFLLTFINITIKCLNKK